MNANSITSLQIQGVTFESLINEIKTIIKEHTPQPQQVQNNELMTRKEVSELLNISLVTLHYWTKKGILKGYRIGNQVRYKKDEVLNALQEKNNTIQG